MNNRCVPTVALLPHLVHRDVLRLAQKGVDSGALTIVIVNRYARFLDSETPRAGQAAIKAFFGATVRYANAAGTERVVSIVGTDEVNLNRNHISWVSPLGRAFIKSTAGERVILKLRAAQNTLPCWKCVTSAFRWNPSANHLEPSPRQRTPSPTPIHLTKVSEAEHEHARPRVRTNCEPTLGRFVPLSFDPSQDRSRKTAQRLRIVRKIGHSETAGPTRSSCLLPSSFFGPSSEESVGH